MPLEFAVVDVETTGFLPERYDRIIEIAIVRTDVCGVVLDHYCTLVNPNRDLGSIRTHGISAADLKNAPTFEEIAGEILDRLAGTVFVAHNVVFDRRFVVAEFRRLDCMLPGSPSLCTMRLARRLFPELPGRSLACVCENLSIEFAVAHHAYADACAAAAVLARCLQSFRDELIAEVPAIPPADTWPTRPRSGRSYRRSQASADRQRQRHYLAELVARLPPSSNQFPQIDEYLELLDRVLEDRRVIAEEAEALHSHAEAVGLSQEQVLYAHSCYMRDLIGLALADRRITEAEERDLEEVRRLLCISSDEYAKLLTLRHADAPPASAARPTEVLQGKTVCFTGEMRCCINGEPAERSVAEGMAQARGMIMKSSVSKKLDYLVAADPDSMSGKAKKARAYGIRIIAEPVFWHWMGVEVD